MGDKRQVTSNEKGLRDRDTRHLTLDTRHLTEAKPSIVVIGDNGNLVSELCEQIEELGLLAFRNKHRIAGAKPDLLVLAVQSPASASGLLDRVRHSTGLSEAPMIGAFAAQKAGSFDLADRFEEVIFLPCSSTELQMRIRRVLSRNHHASNNSSIAHLGRLRIDIEGYEVTRDGSAVALTYMEFNLLKFFLKNTGRVVPREMLFREVWGHGHHGGMRTVDVHVRRLRAKLGEDFEQALQTVRKVGYRLSLR